MKKALYALAMLTVGGFVLAAGMPAHAVGASADAASVETQQTERTSANVHYQNVDQTPRGRWRCWWRNGERWCGWW